MSVACYLLVITVRCVLCVRFNGRCVLSDACYLLYVLCCLLYNVCCVFGIACLFVGVCGSLCSLVCAVWYL